MNGQDLGLQDVCVVIGYDLTRLLAAWFAGSYLYVPAQHRADHPLVSLIGDRPVQALVKAHAGERVWVPASSEDGRHKRDRVIAELIAAGVSTEAISSMLELGVRRIMAIRSELEARGLLVYAGGYRRRGRGRPVDGELPKPDLMISR